MKKRPGHQTEKRTPPKVVDLGAYRQVKKMFDAAKSGTNAAGTPDTVILPADSPLLDGVPIHSEDCHVVRGEPCNCGASEVEAYSKARDRAFRWCFFCQCIVKGAIHRHKTASGVVDCRSMICERLPDGRVIPFGILEKP